MSGLHNINYNSLFPPSVLAYRQSASSIITVCQPYQLDNLTDAKLEKYGLIQGGLREAILSVIGNRVPHERIE